VSIAPAGGRSSSRTQRRKAIEEATVVEMIQVGSEVPDFRLETYDPATGDFGSVSLADLKSRGRWTILFFYPADFTFV
jgi:hypothetical protein